MIDTKEERIEYKCVCSKKNEAHRSIKMSKHPKILVLQFKRFAYNKKHIKYKIHTPVDFPQAMDMGRLGVDEYMKPNQPAQNLGADQK